MNLHKGDIIVFSPTESGFIGYQDTLRRSVVNVLVKCGRPVVSMNGFKQPIELASIKRVLPVREWREVNLGE